MSGTTSRQTRCAATAVATATAMAFACLASLLLAAPQGARASMGPEHSCRRDNPMGCRNLRLRPPPSVHTWDLPNGHLHLDFTTVDIDSYAARFTTRAFAARNAPNPEAAKAQVPGVTLRVRRGQAFSVTLSNRLGPNSAHEPTAVNTYHSPNTTNLHTHGLHESPELPADNVLVYLQPGEQRTYKYEIGDDHAPGLHWWHPHHHGSAALQVGGGAAGLLVIEERPGDVPRELAALPEELMILQNWYMAPSSSFGVLNISAAMGDAVLAPSYQRSGNPGTEGLEDNWWTVNGLYLPTLHAQPGQSVRWRVASASIDETLDLVVAGCSLELLAKDGIVISPAPRLVDRMLLPPGARADVIVTCKEPGVFRLMAQSADDRGDEEAGGERPPPPPPPPGFPYVGELATIVVEGSRVRSLPIPTFYPARPDYLANLVGALPDHAPTQHWNLSLALNGLTINGVPFGGVDGPPLTTLRPGAVEEWQLNPDNARGATFHPLHMHVWPFQIISLTGASGANKWFQVGDWHDSMLVGMEEAAGTDLTVRFQTGRFTGRVVLHCHILAHEDRGMLGFVDVDGGALPYPVSSNHQRCTLTSPSGPPC